MGNRKLIIGIIIGLVAAGALVGAYALGARDKDGVGKTANSGKKTDGASQTPTESANGEEPTRSEVPTDAFTGEWFGPTDTGSASDARWSLKFAGAPGAGTMLITTPDGGLRAPVTYGVSGVELTTEEATDSSGKTDARRLVLRHFDGLNLVATYGIVSADGTFAAERVLVMTRAADSIDEMAATMYQNTNGSLDFDAGDPPGSEAFAWLVNEGVIDGSGNRIPVQ